VPAVYAASAWRDAATAIQVMTIIIIIIIIIIIRL